MSDTSSRRGMFVSGDLMLGTAVIGALSSVCGQVTRGLSGRGLIEKLEAEPVDLLVLDLEAADLDLEGLGALTRKSGRPSSWPTHRMWPPSGCRLLMPLDSQL